MGKAHWLTTLRWIEHCTTDETEALAKTLEGKGFRVEIRSMSASVDSLWVHKDP